MTCHRRATACVLASCMALPLLAGCAGRPSDAGRSRSAPYAGFEADRALMRRTELMPAGGANPKSLNVSSGEAIAAARRVFSRTPLLFRTRAEILELLGDPGTISDYNDPATAGEADPLEYRFDTGFGGFQVTLSFGSDGVVEEIKVNWLN